MPTTIYRSPATTAGTAQNTVNIVASDDATSTHNNNGTAIGTNFTFALPIGATIDGIEVNVESNAVAGTWTQRVQLYDGVVLGTLQETTGILDTAPDVVRAYGGAGDVWGATLTEAIVNSSTFGVQVTAIRTAGGGGTRFAVDHVEMRVTYTEGVGPASRTYVKTAGTMALKSTKAKVGGTQVTKTLKVKVLGAFI